MIPTDCSHVSDPSGWSSAASTLMSHSSVQDTSGQGFYLPFVYQLYTHKVAWGVL